VVHARDPDPDDLSFQGRRVHRQGGESHLSRRLIVVDDIGMLPAGQAEAEALYRIADAAYETRSIAITSNIHPSGFDTIMPKALASPTVDRLLHHAHIIILLVAVVCGLR